MRGLYWAGMLGFVAGIVLEVYGFYLRIAISGWAPVTNMYETVIWVAMITSMIGLVLELISRKVYPALAASGVALLATILAANVPAARSRTSGSLQPVLRSNYWLTIHVLTIVSSYAAFALALGLGLLAIGFYLTATYRRDVDPAGAGRAAGAGCRWRPGTRACRFVSGDGRLVPAASAVYAGRAGGARGRADDRGDLSPGRRAGQPARVPRPGPLARDGHW